MNTRLVRNIEWVVGDRVVLHETSGRRYRDRPVSEGYGPVSEVLYDFSFGTVIKIREKRATRILHIDRDKPGLFGLGRTAKVRTDAVELVGRTNAKAKRNLVLDADDNFDKRILPHLIDVNPAWHKWYSRHGGRTAVQSRIERIRARLEQAAAETAGKGLSEDGARMLVALATQDQCLGMWVFELGVDKLYIEVDKDGDWRYKWASGGKKRRLRVGTALTGPTPEIADLVSDIPTKSHTRMLVLLSKRFGLDRATAYTMSNPYWRMRGNLQLEVTRDGRWRVTMYPGSIVGTAKMKNPRLPEVVKVVANPTAARSLITTTVMDWEGRGGNLADGSVYPAYKNLVAIVTR